MEKISKNAAVAIAIVAVLGIITIATGVQSAVRYFSWPLLILNILETIGFLWTILYILNDNVKSNQFFKYAFWTLVIINAYLIFQSSYFNASVFNTVAEALSIVGMIVIMIKWKDYSITKWVSIAMIVISFANATFVTVKGDYAGEELEFVQIVGSYLLFFLTAGVIGSYMARMSKKAKLAK